MNARAKMVLAIVAVLAVNAGFFQFFIRPKQAELGTVKENIVTAEGETQQLEAELARLKGIQENETSLRSELAELRKAVPEQHEVANFLFQVQTAADEAGLRFVQIDPEVPKQPPEGAALAEVRTAIVAKGGYFAIQDFSRRLYDLNRAMRIDVFEMATESDEAEVAKGNRVSLNIVARIFFELPEIAGTPAGTTGTTTDTTGTTTGTTSTTPSE